MEAEDLELGAVVWQAHGDGDEEAVELGLGEGEGSGGGGVVLGGDDEEGLGESVGLSVDCDLAFVHRFEERGLGAGGGSVDLIGEEEVGEDGAGDELELAIVRAVKLVAEDV